VSDALNSEPTRELLDLEAHHFLSLATLYYSRGKLDEAIDLLELSKQKNPNISKTRFMLGKIAYERGELNRALEEFEKARELDPFYEDIYKHLANIYSQRGDRRLSLEKLLEAYILSGGEDSAKTSYYQRQIRTLMNEMNLSDREQYNQFFEERRRYFSGLTSALTSHRSGAKTIDPLFLKFAETEKNQQPAPDLIAELKKFPVIQSLGAPELDVIARITTQRSFKANEIIFREDDLTEYIYLIQTGSVRIIKTTPFGEQVLSNLGAGEFFGEMDFIDSMQCSADAIATEDTNLLLLTKARLEEVFIAQKQIAVQFYWHFWKTLSRRIRETNDLLKSFFVEAADAVLPERMIEGTPGMEGRVDLKNKMAVLKEKGLSVRELGLLASFSKEESYKANQDIFLEGDQGDRLYIILEGQVRISKFIPGVGEEALAILKKGDFFGEMALVDQAPRSADAKAHTNATVLPIENRFLTDILSRDVYSAYQFLFILCKILSCRLREINLKIYSWRLMSGGF